jgi:hypothetical protein
VFDSRGDSGARLSQTHCDSILLSECRAVLMSIWERKKKNKKEIANYIAENGFDPLPSGL